jgi:hypothetical protein
MHASRATGAALAAFVLLAIGDRISAHRRDDYLQAARIDVEPDRVAIELDLTPGTAVAEPLIAAVDTDRDGWLSMVEQDAYARRALSAVSIAIDGRPLWLELVSTSFPDLAAVRRGEGIIRLRLRTALPDLSAGSHTLYFRNANLRDHSAYLANALVPESARVSVAAQRRTGDQSALTIDYAVGAASPDASRAPLVVTLAFAALLMIPLARQLPRFSASRSAAVDHLAGE